jgi:CubicO group peptidase (beta-lactamase class C family)
MAWREDAALLADDGRLSLDEVGRWLSAGPNGGITLQQLATHTSWLPRLAPTMDLGTVDPARGLTRALVSPHVQTDRKPVRETSRPGQRA